MGGQIGRAGMQGEEVEQVFAGGGAVVAGGGEDVEQPGVLGVELFASRAVALFVDDFEFARHNLEGRHGLHVVLHAMVSAIGLLQLVGVYAVEGGRMGNEEEVGIAVLVHELLGHFLQLLQHGHTDGVGHHVGKLVPYDEQSVVGAACGELVLHFREPLLDVVVVEADVELCLAQGIGHAVVDAHVACLQSVGQLPAVGRYRRQGGVAPDQVVPYLGMLPYLLYVVLVVRGDVVDFYPLLAQGFGHGLLQHQREIAGVGHCAQSVHIDREQAFALAEVVDGLTEGGKLAVFVFIVHPAAYVFNVVAEQVADHGHGMTLAGAVSTVYPEALVVVDVVSAHTLDYRAQHVVELLIGDKRHPLSRLLFGYVVSCFPSAYLYDVVILGSHSRWILLG